MKYLLLVLLLTTSLTISANAQLRAAGEPVLIYDDITTALQQPIPSPDGSKLALTGPNYNGIWVMNQNGDQFRQLSDTDGTGFGLSWSHDGTSLAARATQRTDNRKSFAVMIINADNGSSELLSEFQPHLPSTPFFDAQQQRVLLATSSEIQIYNVPLQRRLSADQASVFTAKASFDRIVVTNVNGELSELRPIADSEVTYLHASISPDGLKLAFSVYGGNLFVQDLNTNELTDFGRGFFPTWSPDSRFISFTRNEDDGYRHTYGEIVAAAADGSQEVVLYSSNITIPANPHWSPVQNRVYFDYMNTGSILYIDVLTN